jgi:preprotein translocase subunit SecF
MELFKYKQSIDFMGWSRKFGILSLLIVLTSWGLIMTKGFNFGIDFAGGTLIQLKYKDKAPIVKIREKLSENKNFKGANVTFFRTVRWG